MFCILGLLRVLGPAFGLDDIVIVLLVENFDSSNHFDSVIIVHFALEAMGEQADLLVPDEHVLIEGFLQMRHTVLEPNLILFDLLLLDP